MKKEYKTPEFEMTKLRITSSLLNDISSGEGSGSGGGVDGPGEGEFE